MRGSTRARNRRNFSLNLSLPEATAWRTAVFVADVTEVGVVLRVRGAGDLKRWQLCGTQLAVCGALTDQCVDHTIRDGADRGLDVTQITGGRSFPPSLLIRP